jgi:hypothetical protein
MNDRTKHVFLAAALLLASIATGCASLDVEGNGNGGDRPDIVSHMQDDSQGK